MPKYIVQDGEKQYNGKAYQPGETIECTVEEAKQMRLAAAPSSPLPPSEGGELSPAGGGAGGGNKGKKK